MKSLKIKLLCTFESHTAGGILMNGRARGLAEQGHDVELIFHPIKYKEYKDKSLTKTDLYSIYSKYPSFVKKSKFMWLLLAPLYVLGTALPILMRLRNSEMVVIHKPLPMSAFFILLLKLSRYKGKICLVQSDWEGIGGFVDVFFFDKIARKMLVSFCEAWAPYKSDILFCASKLIVSRMNLSESLGGKVIYLPCGGDLIPQSTPKLSSTKTEILYVGTFKSLQLITFLIDIVDLVCKKNKDVVFVFVGGGPLYGDLEKAVVDASLTESIVLKNQISREEVLKELGNVHIALMPLNDQYPEAYIEASRSSTKLFEYMSAGKIIIATNFAEPKELLVNDETGYLVGHTAEAFASKIVEVLQKKEKWQGMSDKVHKSFVENFSHSVLMKKLSDFYFKQRD
ncbi:MAG: glycosyltransferase [Fibrobacterales bacterium]